MTLIQTLSASEFRRTPSSELVKKFAGKSITEINDYGSSLEVHFNDGSHFIVSIDDYSSPSPFIEVEVFEHLEGESK